MYNGHNILSEGELVAQLEKVVKNTEPIEEPVGVLTSDDRTFWGKTRRQMMRGEFNALTSTDEGACIFISWLLWFQCFYVLVHQ